MELCDSARAGERGGRRGRGGAARTPSPVLPTHALLQAIQYPAHPVRGTRRREGHGPDRAAQNRAQRPLYRNPPLVPHTSRPPECNVTERQGGTPPPQGSVRAQVAGSRQGKGKHPQHPQHSKRIHGIGAPRQHPSSRREKQQVSSARGSPRTGDQSGSP